jgi:hypothetical protein
LEINPIRKIFGIEIKVKMKKMKKINISKVILLLSFVFGMMACNSNQNQQRGNHQNDEQISVMVEGLSEELSLSGKELEIVKYLFIHHFEEMDKVMAEENVSKDKMDSLKNSFEAKVDSVLNDEQFAKFKTYMENHRPQGGPQGNRPQGGMPQGGPQR